MQRVTTIKWCTALWLLLGLGASGLAQDSLREMLFDEASEALVAANEAEAAMLAPTSYTAGAEHYQRAEELLERGGNLDRIRSELAKAVQAWRKATEATEVARVTLGSAIRARSDAESADAETYAADAWEDGTELFFDATVALEEGTRRGAERLGGRAEARFREAELEAIKANYLNETETLLESADDLRAGRHAPATFASARSLFAEAEKELTENRYDTDRPRSLAQDAKQQANLAIYLTNNLRRIGNDRAALEAFLLEWQTPLHRIGATLDTPVYFGAGHEGPTEELVSQIETLIDENRSQSQELQERKAQIREMESQIASLEDRLGGASEERLALAAQLDQQARIRQRFAAVEQIFDKEEANVLRSGNDVILRLVGLTFDSGKSTIDDSKFALLKKVESAINQFDNSSILVEGHTDAFGNDATNEALSTARAEAVKAYLIANMGLAAEDVVSVGYGESRPIANNETREGRAKNRRIDIVIRPRI